MKQTIIVRDPSPNLFFNLLASIAIVAFIVLIVKAFTIPDFTKDQGWRGWSGLIMVATIILTYGIKLVLRQQLLIDLNKNRYKKGFYIGPLSLGLWKDIPKTDYISIFRQPLKNGKFNYEMNLWYDGIRHIELFYFDDPISGYEASFQVAQSLRVKLVDSRIPNETIEIPFKD